MNLSFWLNGKFCNDEVEPGMMLLELLRTKGCYSVKCEPTAVTASNGAAKPPTADSVPS